MAKKAAKLLAGFDATAGDFVDTHEAALRPVFATTAAWNQFRRQVGEFAFAEALAALESAGILP